MPPRRLREILCIFALIGLPAIADTRANIDDFDTKVQLGMEKTQVIAALGSPRISRRWRGLDRWIYIFYKKIGAIENTFRKELHFKNGKVVYKGDPPKLKELSAEEQDKRNLELVESDNLAWEERQEAAKKSRQEYEDWVLKSKDMDNEQGITVPPFKNVD